MSKKDDEAKEALGEIKDLVAGIEAIKGSKKAVVKKGFGTHVDPAVGAKTRIKKGQRLPGAGRKPNPTQPMREALRDLLGRKLPAKYAKALGIPKGSTWGKAVAWTAAYDMLKQPAVEKFKGYAEESDGKQPVVKVGDDGSVTPLDLGALGNVDEQVRATTDRVRERLDKLRDKKPA